MESLILKTPTEDFYVTSILRMHKGAVQQLCWNYHPVDGTKMFKWLDLQEDPVIGLYTDGVLMEKPEIGKDSTYEPLQHAPEIQAAKTPKKRVRAVPRLVPKSKSEATSADTADEGKTEQESVRPEERKEDG